MSLCVQRIQKREHLKSLFRPPDQENRDVTTPSDSRPTGRHHQTKSGRSQSVQQLCWTEHISSSTTWSASPVPAATHLRGSRAELQCLEHKKVVVVQYLHQCSSGVRPICTAQKPAAASLSCRTAAEGVALGCNSLGLWFVLLAYSSHDHNFTTMSFRA